MFQRMKRIDKLYTNHSSSNALLFVELIEVEQEK